MIEPMQVALPALATVALGAAIFVPIRDDRSGRRASLRADAQPLRASFNATATQNALPPDAGDDASLLSKPTVETTTVSTAAEESRGVEIVERSEEDDAADVSTAAPLGAATPAPGEAERRRHDNVFVLVGRSMRGLLASGCEAIEREPDRALIERAENANHDPSHPTAPGPPDTVRERSFAAEIASLMVSDPGGSCDVIETCADVALEEPPGSRFEAPGSDEAARGITNARAKTASSDRSDAAYVVDARSAPARRVAPLTRLPLRPAPGPITWHAGSLDERLRELQALAVDGHTNTALSARAYYEEDRQGRVLALRAIAVRPDGHVAVLLDALRRRTDEERALAVDGLAAAGEREALISALDDRVDAIAARAALAYAETTQEAAFRSALQLHVSAARLRIIMGMLAGIIE